MYYKKYIEKEQECSNLSNIIVQIQEDVGNK